VLAADAARVKRMEGYRRLRLLSRLSRRLLARPALSHNRLGRERGPRRPGLWVGHGREADDVWRCFAGGPFHPSIVDNFDKTKMLPAVVLTVLPLVCVISLWVASLYDQRFANVVYKLHLLRSGLATMLFSTDRKWKRTPDAEGVNDVDAVKKVIFVRHGESEWNLVFNKGFGADFPGRLGSALLAEAKEATTLDSVFVDSPLSSVGCSQAKSLVNFIEKESEEHSSGLGTLLKGLEGESVIASSNLRRALSTCTIGFWPRLQRTQEKIHILSSLQEVTFNIDGVALAKRHDYPELSAQELAAVGHKKSSFRPERVYDASRNDGTKIVKSVGVDRLKAFASWIFERKEPTIIAAGHSLYNRYFFDTFLPRKSLHESKILKMENCAIVAFDFHRGKLKNGQTWYRIEESSIENIYLGFEQKKVRKSKSA